MMDPIEFRIAVTDLIEVDPSQIAVDPSTRGIAAWIEVRDDGGLILVSGPCPETGPSPKGIWVKTNYKEASRKARQAREELLPPYAFSREEEAVQWILEDLVVEALNSGALYAQYRAVVFGKVTCWYY